MDIKQLYIDEVCWDIRNNCFIKTPLKIGDEIYFIPCIIIDDYQAGAKKSVFNHLVHNIYEFNFTPVERYKNNDKKGCFHYLIELFPGFRLFHFNWFNEYDHYLKVGQMYWGYGCMSNCGDPSRENPFIDSKAIKEIIQRANIKNILVIRYDRDYFENRCPLKDGEVYFGENPLKKLGYPDDYERFKKNLPGYEIKPKSIESTKLKRFSEVLNFYVGLY